MKNKNKAAVNRILFPMILFLIFSFTACLDLDKLNIYLALDKNDLYSGHARLEFINVHSSSANLEEQKKEMGELFTGYKKEADDIINGMPLFNYTVELRNKKELSTDAVIQGEFKNILSFLGALISDNNFRIEGNKKRLSARWGNPFTDSMETNLIITYPGKIISHNSKNFDAKTGTMKWKMSKTGDKEVSFVFESD